MNKIYLNIAEFIGKTLINYNYNNELEFLILEKLLSIYKKSRATSMIYFENEESKLFRLATTFNHKERIVETFAKFKPLIEHILSIRNS